MRSGVDDLILILDWLAASKTPPHNIDDAIARLRKRAQRGVPIDVKMYDNEQTKEEAEDEYIGNGKSPGTGTLL